MPRRTSSFGRYYDPVTGQYVSRSRRRKRSRRVSGLGSLGQFGSSSSLRGTLASVKGVLITGSIAAAGAIITDKVYDKIGESIGLEGWQREAAKIATGIALGIVIAKFLKKPKLAAAFAIGPVVSGMLNIFGEVMSGTSGLGFNAYNRVTNPYSSMYSPLYGANRGALGSTVSYQPVRNEVAETFAPQAPPLSGGYYAGQAAM